MKFSNTYPEGSWILFIIIFSIFGYQYFWRKWKVKSFFSKQWNIGKDIFSSDYIKNALEHLTMNSEFGFDILKHTTVFLEDRKIPVIFGCVDHPMAKPYGPSRNKAKAFFTFSDIDTTNWLLDTYPKIFKQACETELYKVCWILNIRLLEGNIKKN